MRNTLPAVEVLRERLEYNALTGDLIWKIRAPDGTRHTKLFNTRYAGTKAGVQSGGYTNVSITVGGKKAKFAAHRVIWKMMTGKEPPVVVDHINGDGNDNRWQNLRAATLSQNNQNAQRANTNTSGFKGVSYCKMMKKWVGIVGANNERRSTDFFATPEEANEAVKALRTELHGDFARHS